LTRQRRRCSAAEYVRVKALIALSDIGEQKAIPALLELAERPRYPT
jgi:HEAT repeat protein